MYARCVDLLSSFLSFFLSLRYSPHSIRVRFLEQDKDISENVLALKKLCVCARILREREREKKEERRREITHSILMNICVVSILGLL